MFVSMMGNWPTILSYFHNLKQIDDEHHRIALKKNGWTPSEYAAGEKADGWGERLALLS